MNLFIKTAESKRLKDYIFLLLLITLVLNLTLLFLKNQDNYLTRNYWERYPTLKTLYNQSQYANPRDTIYITDTEADAFAGGALITGTNPVLVLADTPPLGKYLIGLSALLFDNENIFVLLSGLGSLAVLYLICMQIFKSKILSILPPLLLSFEPLFQNQFHIVPLFDLFQLFFLLLSFYFFDKGITRVKRILLYFALANIFLGFFISTKFFITGITIVAADYTVLFFHKNLRKLISFTFTLPLAIIVLFLSYIRIFAFGYPFRSLFGIQKYIYLYHNSQLILPFSIWPLIFLNKWYVWFGPTKVLSDPQWSIMWPITTALTIATAILYLLGKIEKNRKIEVIMAWCIYYLLFFSIGQIHSRYLVILLPIQYVVALYGLTKIIPSVISLFKPSIVQLYQRP